MGETACMRNQSGVHSCNACFIISMLPARMPSDMGDEREKHPICGMCHDERMPTTRTDLAIVGYFGQTSKDSFGRL